MKSITTKKEIIASLPIFHPDSIPAQWDGVEMEAVEFFEDYQAYEPVHGEDIKDATHYSVYLHNVEGGVQCVADVATKKEADDLYDLLAISAKQFKHPAVQNAIDELFEVLDYDLPAAVRQQITKARQMLINATEKN